MTQHRPQRHKNKEGLPGLVFGIRFAHADDGNQPSAEGGFDPFVDGFIRFAKIGAPFGVADPTVTNRYSALGPDSISTQTPST